MSGGCAGHLSINISTFLLPTPFVASDCLRNCEYGICIDAFKLILN